LEKKQEAQAKADAEQDQYLEESFNQLRKMGEKIPQQVEEKVLTEMIRTGKTNVLSVYADLKGKEAFKDTIQQQKAEGFVPKTGGGTGADVPKFSYGDIRNKSLDDIMDEA